MNIKRISYRRISRYHRINFSDAILAFFAFGVVLLWAFHSVARDWSEQPANIRQWFQSLMQPDAPSVSCCGEADAFEADAFEVEGDHYIAIITDGRGVLPNGMRVVVPNGKMKWDAGNPTGHGVIFIGTGGSLYCYVAPSGV